MSKKRIIVVTLFTLLSICLMFQVVGAETVFINIGTASTGGSYYPAGTTIANVLDKNLKIEGKNLVISAQATAGSTENIDMLRNDEMEMAVMNASVASQAYQGTGLYENSQYKELRTITQLWSNPIQMVVTKKSGIDSWSDLKGHTVSIGQAGSGSEVLSKEQFDALPGISIEDINVEHLGFSQSADAMKNGRIDAAQLSGGIPVSSVLDLFVSPIEVKLLSYTDEEVEAVNAKYPHWQLFIIEADTYSNQKEDAKTVALFTQFTVRGNLDEEVVYQFTKAMFENQEQIHESYKGLAEMTLDRAVMGLVAPLHPGAIRYYKEQGIEVPDNLIPPEYQE